MYVKLALRNVKKSFRDYAIYFLTLLFGVCIFYVFNSIDSQQSMMIVTKSEKESLETLQKLIDYVSVFVSVILGFLIVYANRFLVRRRKKELGIYQTLGMHKGQIARILTIETLVVALLSLAAGLGFGVLISQGFAVLTAALFEVKLSGFRFIFSSAAAIKAMAYFGIAFGLVIIFNHITVGKQKLIDLLYAEKKNERFRVPHLVLSVFVFLAAVACLGTAYYLVDSKGMRLNDELLLTSIALGIVGTFLFFYSLSGFFLKVAQGSKRVYFKGLNMFVLRQINSKINTAFVSISMVCLMLFLAICALAFGMGFSKAITADLEMLHPYDVTLSTRALSNIYDEATGDTIESTFIPINWTTELNRVEPPLRSYATGTAEATLREVYVDEDLYDGLLVGDFMMLSDFNKLRELQGLSPIAMATDEFIFNCLSENHRNAVASYFGNTKAILCDTPLTLKCTDSTPLYNTAAIGNYTCICILPDALLAETGVFFNIVAINYIESTHEYIDMRKTATAAVMENIRTRYQTPENTVETYVYNPSDKLIAFEDSKSTSVIVAYLAVYLGILFAVISAVVLAITQLSEASDNSHRYGLLRKLGADAKMIDRALFRQIAIYFGVPLMLALVHAFFGIRLANTLLESIGRTSVLRDSLITAGILTVVYGGYFLATYWGSKGIVTRK